MHALHVPVTCCHLCTHTHTQAHADTHARSHRAHGLLGGLAAAVHQHVLLDLAHEAGARLRVLLRVEHTHYGNRIVRLGRTRDGVTCLGGWRQQRRRHVCGCQGWRGVAKVEASYGCVAALHGVRGSRGTHLTGGAIMHRASTALTRVTPHTPQHPASNAAPAAPRERQRITCHAPCTHTRSGWAPDHRGRHQHRRQARMTG
jgi:hypothetical protein